MAQFNYAFKSTMAEEGGYSNNPKDHGGETYKGISRKFWGAWPGWPIVDRIKAGHTGSLNSALEADDQLQLLIGAFYRDNFWNPLSLDGVTDQQIANQVFDTAVNMGTTVAARFVQEAVDAIKPGLLHIDAVIGKQSVAAVNALDPAKFYSAFIALRKAKYLAILKNDPSQKAFEASWLSRLKPYHPNA